MRKSVAPQYKVGYAGRNTAAIKKWIDVNLEKYQDTLDATNLIVQENQTILTAQVFGTFDGSLISLDFHFNINDGKITMLSIGLTGS